PLTRRMHLYLYGRMRALGGRLKLVRHGGSGARVCRYRRPNSLVFALADEKPEQSRNDQKSTHHQEDKTCIAVEKPGEERVSDDVGLFAIEQIDAEPRQHVGNGNQGGATTEGCTEHASARTWTVVERQPDAIADCPGCNDEQGDGDREPSTALGETGVSLQPAPPGLRPFSREQDAEQNARSRVGLAHATSVGTDRHHQEHDEDEQNVQEDALDHGPSQSCGCTSESGVSRNSSQRVQWDLEPVRPVT